MQLVRLLPGFHHLSSIQLARAIKELKVPFVASGGIADARGLAAVLALGAAVSFYLCYEHEEGSKTQSFAGCKYG